MTTAKRLAIFGSTGSIGTQTLDIVDQHPDRFVVDILVAGRNATRLAEQIKKYQPRAVAVADDATARALRTEYHVQLPIAVGDEAIADLATSDSADIVVAAIVGAAGLRSTAAAVRAGKVVALANKESMVVAGPLMQRWAAESGAVILPVDSEHAGVHQSMIGQDRAGIRQVILTASGGPFRDLPAEAFASITVEQALKHPNWEMGAKITIDSATLMNKGLEIIEARWLFALDPTAVGAVVHRESVVHALVEYCDGTMLAQLANPDMRAPIAYALAYPERITTNIKALNLAEIGNLSFSAPDEALFPCFGLAKAANLQGGIAPAILNAANEVAVAAFLERSIGFNDIARVVGQCLENMPGAAVESLDQLVAIDAEARSRSTEIVARSLNVPLVSGH